MQREGTYCSTCGARVPLGRTACDTCGARLAGAGWELTQPMSSRVQPVAISSAIVAIGTCPRCGYRGEGLGFFSRGTNVAVLVAATMFTSWAMGAGGLVYYMMRREHRICPRCRRSWGRFDMTTAPRPDLPASASDAAVQARGGNVMAGLAVLLFVLATILAVGAIVEGTPGPLLLAALAAGAGVLVHRVAETEREERRAALISNLQLPVLQLATRSGGRLTVTQVAAQLGWTLARAEKVLRSLEDGFRVTSEVTDDGLIVYEFRELLPPSRPHSA